MRIISRLLGILMAPVVPLSLAAQVINTESGQVEGVVENGVSIYRGIPFAAPPVGDLRWRPPQPVRPWEGIRKADRFAPACPQPNIKVLGYLDYGMSEDCLYLNIWKPELSAEKLPVMVWIHGGGLSLGSTSQAVTTGEQLAKRGVIVVSIAYRLGMLGFLSHPELSAESEDHVSGNYGLLDQIAALRWVQRNIAAFGGDPANVTLFGESAGGQSVHLLSASPLATGLFHRAISMSGGAFWPVTETHDRDCGRVLKSAEAAGLEFAQSLGAKTLADLRRIDAQKLVIDPELSTGPLPVVDGYIIPDDLYILYQKGQYTDVPLLLGSTSGEGTMFILKDKYRKYEKETRQRYGPVADDLLELYPKGNKAATRTSMAELFRDSYFGWFAYAWATLQTQTGKSPVYLYYFNPIQPASFITMFARSREAYHGSDCAYVFDHLDQNPKIRYTDGDRNLSQAMVDYWINFARTGNPNGGDLPEWPAYASGKPTVMYLNSASQTGEVPNLDRLRVIDQYYEWKRNKN